MNIKEALEFVRANPGARAWPEAWARGREWVEWAGGAERDWRWTSRTDAEEGHTASHSLCAHLVPTDLVAEWTVERTPRLAPVTTRLEQVYIRELVWLQAINDAWECHGTPPHLVMRTAPGAPSAVRDRVIAATPHRAHQSVWEVWQPGSAPIPATALIIDGTLWANMSEAEQLDARQAYLEVIVIV